MMPGAKLQNELKNSIGGTKYGRIAPLIVETNVEKLTVITSHRIWENKLHKNLQIVKRDN